MLSLDILMKISRVFIRSGGERRRGRGRRETTVATTTWVRERGPHPWRTPLETKRSTASSPPDTVILLLMPKTTSRTKMTTRGAW